MGNLCCRKVAYNTYSPTAYICSNRSRKSAPPPPIQQASPTTEAGPAMTSYHSSDDCAINELLEGRMELEVILPDGRSVRLTVERRTPMMDLLVQATTANKISPGGHVIHIWTDRGKDFVHYKPSTPIGSLDTNTIYIVPKKEIIEPPVKRMPKLANQPFEPTFRLQVHLPRNQLMVLRVSRKLTMSELKSMVCSDKGLDPNRYQLVHPHQPSRALEGATTLSQYGFAEISLLSNSSIQANLCHSTSDLIAYSSREDDRKKKGILALMSKKGCESVSSSSDEFDSPGELIVKKDHQVVTQAPKTTMKKRQAPPPPPSASSNSRPHATNAPSIPPKKKHTGGGTQSAGGTSSSHSRHSSDSSGYHEASIFDESPEHSAPETSSGSSGVSSLDGLLHNGDDQKPAVSKKRKAPQPPVKQNLKEELQVLQNSTPEITVAHVSVRHIANEQLLSSEAKSVVLPVVEAKGSVELMQNSIQNSTSEDKTSGKPAPSTLKIKDEAPTEKENKSCVGDSKSESGEPNPVATEDEQSVFLPETETVSDDGVEIRRKSLSSSSTTIDDLQDAFEDTIAEAQRLIDQEDKDKQAEHHNEGGDQAAFDAEADEKPVTKLALATITALIEQDVTQREIASHIEAAFYNVDGSGSKNSSPVSHSTEEKEDDWRYPLPAAPQPPPTAILSRCSATPTPFLLAIKQRKSAGEHPKRGEDSSDIRGQQTQSVTVTERPRSADVTRSRLNNFTIGSYGEQSNGDGQTSTLPSCLQVSEKRLVKSESFSNLDAEKQLDSSRKGKYGGPGIRIRSFVDRNSKKLKPNDNKVYGVEGSVRGIKGQVRRRCSELLDWTTTTPSVIARSSSLLDLSNAIAERTTFKGKGTDTPLTPEKQTTNLKRSVSAHSLEQKSEFLAEQERLQQEYLKLQKQFVLWQKQLLSNHAVLQEERIMPASAALPTMPPRTLRQSQSLPNGVPESHSSLSPDSETFEDESSSGGASLVLRSLSYEPTTLPRSAINIPVLDVNGTNAKNGSSSLRSSTTKTHFKPPQIRPSTKCRQRLPPEVRKEDDSGSDLLSRIHEELKSSSLILPPKFPSKTSNEETPAVTKLQAIFQNGGMKHENVDKPNGPSSGEVLENGFGKKILTNGVSSSLEKKPISNSAIFSKKTVQESTKTDDSCSVPLRKRHGSGFQSTTTESSLLKTIGVKSKEQNSEKVVVSKPPVALPTSLSVKVSETSEVKTSDSNPPPPPPPLPIVTNVKKSSVSTNIAKPAEKKVHKSPSIDPREELMLEIRNFGGRRALKKTSLDSPSWTTTVYNTASAPA